MSCSHAQGSTQTNPEWGDRTPQVGSLLFAGHARNLSDEAPGPPGTDRLILRGKPWFASGQPGGQALPSGQFGRSVSIHHGGPRHPLTAP